MSGSSEIECAELDTKLLHQELPKIGLHLVMARAAGEMMQEFAGRGLSVNVCSISANWAGRLLYNPQISLITARQATQRTAKRDIEFAAKRFRELRKD